MSDSSLKRMTETSAQENRLELLLFYLDGEQPFGINVLKVKEIIPCPRLTHVPQSHPAVCGVTQLREQAVTILDLAHAIGRKPVFDGKSGSSSVIVAEFNRSRQGFLVSRVDRIVVCDWKQVLPPPAGTGMASYITGVTRVNDHLVQILDVERIIGEVVELDVPHTSALTPDPEVLEQIRGKCLMVVDDSTVARHKTVQTLDELGIEHVTARDGREALEMLNASLSGEGRKVDMVISDIEMPEMDGYSLTKAIRANPALADLHVLLHTSLNGDINTEKARKAGADAVLTKFVPEDLAKAVISGLTAE